MVSLNVARTLEIIFSRIVSPRINPYGCSPRALTWSRPGKQGPGPLRAMRQSTETHTIIFVFHYYY